MALTAYCKKCRREVEPGEICSRCGTRLAKTAVHAAWVVERRPAADWMCWNAVMRWLVPAGLVLLALVLGLEWISGGTEALERLIRGGFFSTVGGMAAGLMAAVFAVLLCRGKELTDYVVDSRGVHVTTYLPQPTALKLLARLKSPRLLEQADPEAETPLLRLEERDLPWREVARVQLWPEKCYILFYAPAWWQRLAVRCTPFSWDDALYFVRDKLGKKKSVELPEHLRTQAGRTASRAARSTAAPEKEASPGPLWAEPEDAYGNPEPDFFRAPGKGPEPEDGGDGAAEATVPPSVGEQMALDLENPAEDAGDGAREA